MIDLNPHTVFESLCERMKTRRSLRSLEAIHEVCKMHKETGATDFRVATIVRLGEGKGVPTVQTIKNKTGEPYRTLIKAWQHTVPKPKRTRAADEWISEIQDPRLRFLVEDLAAKNRKLEREIREFSRLELKIDLRESVIAKDLPDFIDSEFDALKGAIDREFFKKMGWTSDTRGRVCDADGNRIYGPDYITAIEKILIL
ncbi:gamma-mobile-trio protein GmtX [Hahella aquimaris]|uniref:gamma-mobile-trio protein GmtX n=1 Tax=Hahella sp. HNIBRBA332 TaxID=3015983 RepID=UPI00273C8C6B|nr:gamma-mobile-trio protein GmtX [Hahella sp. HNIBRBA332]WLQ16820.1 gamma-mobile-trio protein GmtX [Hahella sp. HNIBRBA332]